MKLLLVFSAFIFLSFMRTEMPPCTEKKLRDECPFPIGVAVKAEKLKYDEKYRRLVPFYNSITTEKIMKPDYLHPKRNTYNFDALDNLIGYCKEKKIRLHGHTLVWHKANPAWLEKFEGTPQEWEQVLKQHIQTIIVHSRDYVKSWDVVNEAFNEDGTLRKNIWLKNIGESYIEKAFRFAAEADPEALLFYNDHSLENYGVKFKTVINYLEKLRAKGVKIDGIGMQMHVALDLPYISDINQATIHLQEKDFLVHYSELDVNCVTGRNFFTSKKTILRQQKDRYQSIVESFMQLKPKYRFGITLWGVSDNDSWLTEKNLRSKPLLYDDNYKLKPAYCGFLEGLKKGKSTL